MTLILHEMAHSPYCIPIRRLLEAHRVPFEIRTVSSWDRRELAELTGWAYYQVPVIEHEGRVIHETPNDPLAVARYLDDRLLGGRLFPAQWAGIQEILVDHIENTLEGKGFKLQDPHYLDRMEDPGERLMVLRHKERRFGAGCVEAWRAQAPALKAELEAALVPCETRLAQQEWLLAGEPLYADYALLGVLGNVLYGGHHHLSDRLPHLNRWMVALSAYRAPQG